MTKHWSRVAVPTTLVVLGLAVAGLWKAPVMHAQTPAAAAPVALTGTWTIDPAHTNVNFGIRHFGISTVRGRFDEVSGTIVANAERPEDSTINVTIKTASVNTGIKQRDDHLRTADFLEAEKYPTITFKSTRIEKQEGGRYLAHGDFTLHGVTKSIALPFEIQGPMKDPSGKAHLGTETRVRINRQDYGIKYGQVLDNGALAIGNDVDITISLEAVPAPSTPSS